jgi:hypothetical protein
MTKANMLHTDEINNNLLGTNYKQEYLLTDMDMLNKDDITSLFSALQVENLKNIVRLNTLVVKITYSFRNTPLTTTSWRILLLISLHYSLIR